MLEMNADEDPLEFRGFGLGELNLSSLGSRLAHPLHSVEFRSWLKMEYPGSKRLFRGVLETMLFTWREKEKGVRIRGNLSLAVPNGRISVRYEGTLKERMGMPFALRVRAVAERAE